jgi:four helix bundle protein
MDLGRELSCNMTKGYRALRVWQDGKRLAVSICRLCQRSPLASEWFLRDQISRAAISIPSNLAEGEARGSERDSVRFFYIAAGSLAELRTQLEISQELGFVSEETLSSLDRQLELLAAQIGSLIRTRSNAFRPKLRSSPQNPDRPTAP